MEDVTNEAVAPKTPKVRKSRTTTPTTQKKPVEWEVTPSTRSNLKDCLTALTKDGWTIFEGGIIDNPAISGGLTVVAFR